MRWASAFAWQGRQDSNPQPWALEAPALPIELLPCVQGEYTTEVDRGQLLCSVRLQCATVSVRTRDAPFRRNTFSRISALPGLVVRNRA